MGVGACLWEGELLLAAYLGKKGGVARTAGHFIFIARWSWMLVAFVCSDMLALVRIDRPSVAALVLVGILSTHLGIGIAAVDSSRW